MSKLLIGVLVLLLMVALSLAIYPLRTHRKTVKLLTPFMIIMLTMAYWHWGAWGDWQDYLQQSARQEQALKIMKSMKSPDELIERFKAKLEQEPNSARGWFLLGRLYASQKSWQLAEEAFAKAYELQPDDDAIIVNAALNKWQLNNRQFNTEIENLLLSTLKKNPNQPDALMLLGQEALEKQNYQAAIGYWQRLLTLLPSDSEDGKAIRKAIAKAQTMALVQ